jgi:hypothetical protein
MTPEKSRPLRSKATAPTTPPTGNSKAISSRGPADAIRWAPKLRRSSKRPNSINRSTRSGPRCSSHEAGRCSTKRRASLIACSGPSHRHPGSVVPPQAAECQLTDSSAACETTKQRNNAIWRSFDLSGSVNTSSPPLSCHSRARTSKMRAMRGPVAKRNVARGIPDPGPFARQPHARVTTRRACPKVKLH